MKSAESVGICGSEDAALNRRLTQIMRIAQISICGINVICMNLRFRCKKKILSAYKNYKGFEPQTDADYEDCPRLPSVKSAESVGI